jgi:hypothetical protein
MKVEADHSVSEQHLRARAKQVEVGRDTPVSDSETRCVSRNPCGPNTTRDTTAHSPASDHPTIIALSAGLYRPTNQGRSNASCTRHET